MSELKLSKVFEKIARAYKKYRYIINQGGTSSTKTFSTLQFLVILALKYDVEIDIVGLTQNHLKSGVLLDMPKVLAQFGLSFYDLFSKTNTDSKRGEDSISPPRFRHFLRYLWLESWKICKKCNFL